MHLEGPGGANDHDAVWGEPACPALDVAELLEADVSTEPCEQKDMVDCIAGKRDGSERSMPTPIPARKATKPDGIALHALLSYAQADCAYDTHTSHMHRQTCSP